MNRRDFLRAGTAVGAAGAVGLAGCIGMDGSETGSKPTESAESADPGQREAATTVEDRDEAVYHPTHREGATMVGTGGTGRYEVGLMYSLPHPFWTITGTDTNLAQVGDDATAHLMATVWDAETETVLPTANVSATVLKDGEEVDSRNLWPMLSQNMGYHFGDNVSLDGDGTYTAELSVGAMQARGMGPLEGAFGEQTDISVEFQHSRETLSNVSYEEFPDEQGDPGALETMDMEMPVSTVPERSDLPGVVGTASSGDADFVAFTPDRSPHFAADGTTYLAVSPRTPYNRYPLPFMSLSATLTRDGGTVYDDVLDAALDPDLGYHYGAAVDGVESGDSLSITVDAPPQISRHEGYETAFVQMAPVELTL